MIRPVTILTALLAIGSGFYLYQAKHRTRLLDERIGAVQDETRTAQDQIAVLRAEWALENAPSRLAELAARYLVLEPMQPSQAVSMADLASRLPPPALPGAAPPAGAAAPELPTIARLPSLALYASLDLFAAPQAAAARVAAAPVAAPAPVPATRPAAPPSLAAAPAGAGEAIAAAPPPPLAAAPPAPRPRLVAQEAAARSRAVRPLPIAMPAARPAAELTSALGGRYPDLPPPTPLAGSH